MARGAIWTDVENAALVRAYMEMLRLELAGERYSKSAFRRVVQDQIHRSSGAIEYKLQNVSAALYEINHPFINGYKPARNLQDSLRTEVLRQLDATPDIERLAFDALRSPVLPERMDLVWAVTGAPQLEFEPGASHGRRGRRLDFVRIDAENRALGLAGETAVVARERAVLALAGRPDLASRVEHVSQTRGDGLGFDVLSFTDAGRERFLEVKTTKLGRNWPMLVSRNEVDFSRSEKDRFELHRVFDFDAAHVGLYVLRGDISRTCHLRPTTYHAIPA